MKLHTLALLTAGFLGAAGPAPGEGARKGKLEGTWQVVQAEFGGEKAPPNGLKEMKVVLTGDTLSIQLATNVRQLGDYKTDATKKPKTIDLVPTIGPDKGKVLAGIYRLNGDSLELCFSDAGKD